jgi:intracellular multiplication protein IcmK
MGGSLMKKMTKQQLKHLCLLSLFCSLILFAQAADAQTNNGQAPLLPPPPAEALQPIDAPAEKVADKTKAPAATKDTAKPAVAATPAAPTTTPTTNLGSGNTETATTPVMPATPEITPVAAAPAADGSTPVTTTTTSVTTTTPAIGPIALPGMPGTEAALANSSTNPAAVNLNPALVGAGYNNAAYDQAAYEEQLKQRLAEIKVETRQRALQNAKDSVFPMKPEEIQDIIRQLRSTQAAIQKPLEVPPPTPRAVVHTMELDPGALPPTIQLLNGNVTSLTILDATGQPWPIVDIAFGGPFDVKPPESGGHIVRISPLKEYARGNMSIRLQKLATPLTFTLESGGREVHYRFDARIPQLGPNAKAQLIDHGITLSAGDDSYLSSILVGTPPPGAERLKVSGVDGRTSAYRLGGSTYVRTPYTLLSPSWQSSASSADGTNVYVMGDAPVLLLSDNGTMVRAQLQAPIIDPLGLPDSQKAGPGDVTQNASGERG